MDVETCGVGNRGACSFVIIYTHGPIIRPIYVVQMTSHKSHRANMSP